MSIENLKWETVTMVIAVLVLALTLFDKWYTSRKNYKAFVKEKNEPIDKINERLANDKARLDNHEMMIRSLQEDAIDTREGLNVIGKGVQALLERDDSKMKTASDEINNWVWEARKTDKRG